MKIDVRARNDLNDIVVDTRLAEELGCHGVWNAETDVDPFPGLTLMAEHTEKIEFGPSIAVAFARTPMMLAYSAHLLQDYSRGRFILGLGSQIRPHIERRYSMPWSQPAARMREYITALHAIWHTWQTGEPLAHNGEFYTHSLMPPAFQPPAHPFGPPKVFVAAVGPHMLRTAGAAADGVFTHAFSTEKYLRDVVVPTVRAACREAGRPDDAVQIAVSTFVALDDVGVNAVRQQIGFYGATPAYRAVLEAHGWGDLQSELHAMTKQNRWDELGRVIDDDVLQAMCVVGSAADVAKQVRTRFGGIADRIAFNDPTGRPQVSRLAELIGHLQNMEIDSWT